MRAGDEGNSAAFVLFLQGAEEAVRIDLRHNGEGTHA